MHIKHYQIEHMKFRLKEDLTVEESEKVQLILNSFYSAGEDYVNENMQAGDIKKFLSIVIEPEEPDSTGVVPDFGKAKESVVMEIIKDFFLRRMRLAMNMTAYFRNLMKESGIQLPDLTN